MCTIDEPCEKHNYPACNYPNCVRSQSHDHCAGCGTLGPLFQYRTYVCEECMPAFIEEGTVIV